MRLHFARCRKVSSLVVFWFLGVVGTLHAQSGCAGSDGSIIICNYTDPATQTINLFTLLGNSPTPGGTWVDPMQTGGLDSQTGMLDIWDIHTSGIFVFTYSVNNGSCVDTSTVTVTIGGYSGIGNAENSACSNDNSVNLFQFFESNTPNPHQNGIWTDDDTGAVISSIFNASAAGIGTYNFTYTMPAIGTCPEMSTSIAVTVYRSPVSGTKTDLIFCNIDDFSAYTNVNLFDQLAGEDANGQWTETTTNELDGPFDSFINVQNLFTTYGLGSYSFTYTVYPPHPVCTPKITVVRVVFERFIDMTGATLTVTSDICEDQISTATYTAVITPGIQPVVPGAFNITYEITGPQNTTFTQTVQYFNNFTFQINRAFFPVVGVYTITLTNIKRNSDLGACENIINASDQITVYPTPDLTNALLTLSPMCQNVDGQVDISSATNLDTGTYQITYSLSGSNVAADQPVTISYIAGNASFTIPAALLQNLGATTITILSVVNVATGCANTAELEGDFVVNGNIITNLTTSANNICSNSAAIVAVSGLGTMSSVQINYDLSGANTAVNQTITVPVVSGNASVLIPQNLLVNTGTTTFTITQITDNVTLCTATVNVSVPIQISPVPLAPAATDTVFCAGENASVSDLVPFGSQYQWYDSATATVPLAPSTPLVPGQYYVGESLSQCESDRTEIMVTIVSVEQLILNPGGDDFCGSDQPTLQDLSDNVQANNVLVWYDALLNGNELSSTTQLQDNATYYGVNTVPGSPCVSAVLVVKVSLDECEGPGYELFIPDGFSPNGDAVNDVFRIPEIEFIFPDYTLEIYNRFGNLMFKGNKANPAWDGKSSESTNIIDGIAPNGVYFYVLYYNEGNLSPLQGQLYLNR
ncbi:MAG TPA: gliding motility-associated C-terminal domain-containing protein [Flavobacterium sp.]|jgi:gliding motility-associated-like protein